MLGHNQVQPVKRIIRVIKLAVIISLFGFTETHNDHILPKISPDKEIKVKMASRARAQCYQLAIVSKSINKAKYLSNNVRNLIKNSMQKASNKYRIPIILMHAVFKVESDYQYWVTHPTVMVNVDGKKVGTYAIGLGGVMWCFWKDRLRANGIAETKSDLYLPEVNIMASAYILRTMIDDEKKNNPQLNKLNILNNVVRKYYGKYNRTYIKKMQRFTSKLWMQQVAALLMNEITKKDSNQRSAAASMLIKSQSTNLMMAKN